MFVDNRSRQKGAGTWGWSLLLDELFCVCVVCTGQSGTGKSERSSAWEECAERECERETSPASEKEAESVGSLRLSGEEVKRRKKERGNSSHGLSPFYTRASIQSIQTARNKPVCTQIQILSHRGLF